MKQELNTKKVRLEDNNVVIKKHIKNIEGGRTLGCTGFTPDVIKAGHVIICSKDGVYKPMPVSGTAFGTLPEEHKYVGILISSILKEAPAAAIMTWGVVNEAAMPYAVAGIKSAFLTACPHIEFTKDEEA